MRDATDVRRRLREGLVIPAHPLALDANRELDERHQRALTRYYLDAGAGGLAVGVHTTQFEIHDDEIGLYEPTLELAMEEANVHTEETDNPHPVMVAGIVGDTDQAVEEAQKARSIGYDCGLLSLAAFPDATIGELINHAESVAAEIPLMGFYLQPDVGGRHLPFEFWKQFAAIDNLVGIKIAPFDRYQTNDVVRAVAESGRSDSIVLYTGNDDSIINDLLTTYPHDDINMVGGLLGQWAVWTKTAVETLEEIKQYRQTDQAIPQELLTRGAALVDANAAIFDSANDYAGCIPGIHEILRRQNLLEGRWCLDPDEMLSPGQKKEIDRVCETYPELQDDEFIETHLDEWLQ